jgi:WD40 repeat protein
LGLLGGYQAWLKEPEKAHFLPITGVAFSPDGKSIASGSADMTYCLWDVRKAKHLDSRGAAFVAPLTFTPEGRSLIIADVSGEVCFWHLSGNGQMETSVQPSGEVNALAISPDSEVLALCIAGKRSTEGSLAELQLWSLASGKRKHSARLEEDIEKPKTITRKEMAEGAKLLHQISFRGRGTSVAFDPQGKTVACATDDGAIRSWRVDTGKELAPCVGHKGAVNSIAFSPNGRTLVSGGSDRTVRLWETFTARERWRFAGHHGDVTSVVFSRNGKSVASGSRDSTILIWRLPKNVGQARSVESNLSEERLQAIWVELAGKDAHKAYEGICSLADSPDKATAFLKSRAKPACFQNRDQVTRLIADLDSMSFEDRERATKELAGLGEEAEYPLRMSLSDKSSAEFRRRVEDLLEMLDGRGVSSDTLRVLRVIEALEEMATPSSQALLVNLAKGAAEARQTREAKAALDRMRR